MKQFCRVVEKHIRIDWQWKETDPLAVLGFTEESLWREFGNTLYISKCWQTYNFKPHQLSRTLYFYSLLLHFCQCSVLSHTKPYFSESSGQGLLGALTMGFNPENLTRDDCTWRRGSDRDPCPDPDVSFYLYTPGWVLLIIRRVMSWGMDMDALT